MLWMLLFLLQQPTDAHPSQNPIYADLLARGVTLAPSVRASLASPTMCDGLTPAQQREVIEKLPGRQTPTEELLRLSTVAPFVLKIRDLDSGVANAPGRAVDLYFVAQGRLADLEKSELLNRLLNSGRQDARIRPLTPEEVAHRVTRPTGPATDHQAYAHVAVPLMDRVLLSGTCATSWSRTTDSLLVAGHIDPRFSADREFPNEWRRLKRTEDGKLEPDGAGHRYEAAGYYLKLTRLREPDAALFIEWHLVFAEPSGWFDGANLLRSKLPLVLQTKVRGFRRDLLRDPQK